MRIPESFETERLLIRSPLPGDGTGVYEAIIESIDTLRPWLPWAKQTPTLQETERNVRKARRAFLDRSDLRLHLYLKSTGEFVGGSGLHRIKWEVPSFEIGYWCRNRFVGQGLITEAVRGITCFAFDTLGARRVEVRCAESNVRSRAVIERVGFRLEGTLRNNGLTEGRLRDTLVFSMIPEEYEAVLSPLAGKARS